MAELAIHDPHYLNVESDQKTAIVHLFHNPIPADGHRDEGPEWAREVDDIYLIGGVGPDGPTVKTVTNDEVTDWGAGGIERIARALVLTLTNNTGFDLSNIGEISIYKNHIAPMAFSLSNGESRRVLGAMEFYGELIYRMPRRDIRFNYNGTDLPITIYTIATNDYEVVIDSSTLPVQVGTITILPEE